MAQSCANISNGIVLDLEKKIESLCKGASSYYSSFFKKIVFKNLQNAKIILLIANNRTESSKCYTYYNNNSYQSHMFI